MRDGCGVILCINGCMCQGIGDYDSGWMSDGCVHLLIVVLYETSVQAQLMHVLGVDGV